MRLVKPSYKITTQINGESILAAIEDAARTCYKSEDKIEIRRDQGLITEAVSARDLVAKLIKRGHEAMLEFGGMITVRFVCDRGVSHEFVRHRVASFAQESTRYCNYGKGEHVQFIIPCWLDLKEGIYNEVIMDDMVPDSGTDVWSESMLAAEKKYTNLVNQINPKTGQVDLRMRKWTPQEARSVLPNSLKTEINVSANIRQWRLMFNLRTANAAHPQMQELMRPLLHEFQEKIPILFDDIKY